jgi:hypothetical protein
MLERIRFCLRATVILPIAFFYAALAVVALAIVAFAQRDQD